MTARAALALVLAALAAGCGGGGDDEAAEETVTADGGTATACRDVEQEAGSERTAKAPTEILDATKTYRVRVSTSCGAFTITLDPEASPKAAASFAALARAGFYDGTYIHRIVPGFVIQGGDPTGTGSGGPGYSTVDTPARSTTYERGIVAMAKTAAEAPGTAGSQFFVVTGPDAGLPPDYAVIGRVTAGVDVVARIAVLGDPNTELPTQPVVVDEMTLQVS